MVFTTPRGWALIVIGGLVGIVFAWMVLALSVVSLPMLVDRDVSAADAVSASWRAANANKPEMVRWGLTVTALARDRLDPACSSGWRWSCRGSAIRPGTSTRG